MTISPDEARAKRIAKAVEYADYLERWIDEKFSSDPMFSDRLFFYCAADTPSLFDLDQPEVEAELTRRYVARGWKKLSLARKDFYECLRYTSLYVLTLTH